jgi:hypothetical protein
MPPACVGALQVGGPVGELRPGAAVEHRAPDGGARLAAVGELVPDVVGGGGAGEQRPIRPGDQLGQRRRGVAARNAASAPNEPRLSPNTSSLGRSAAGSCDQRSWRWR